MGNIINSSDAEEKNISVKLQQDEGNEFYWACRNGDVEHVKQLLRTIPYNDLNQVEFNGSTPLHAASSYGHAEIVTLLLREDYPRKHRDLDGLTAYERAQTEQIRCLFHRPDGKNRFCDENNEEGRVLFHVATRESEGERALDGDYFEDQWIIGHMDGVPFESIEMHVVARKTLYQSKLGRMININRIGYISLLKSDQRLQFAIDNAVDSLIPQQHSEYAKCKSLVIRAFVENQPEHLLQLYTLETPFYRSLNKDQTSVFGCAIERFLDKLSARYFQGTSYRGVKMTSQNLRVYQWALKKNGVLITATHNSTSKDKQLAEFFAEANAPAANERVLMIFSFSQQCDTAIDLSKISDELPCISKFENETEVLVLRFTFFIVKEINTETNPTTITLENIPATSSWLAVWKYYKMIRTKLNRFKQS